MGAWSAPRSDAAVIDTKGGGDVRAPSTSILTGV